MPENGAEGTGLQLPSGLQAFGIFPGEKPGPAGYRRPCVSGHPMVVCSILSRYPADN